MNIVLRSNVLCVLSLLYRRQVVIRQRQVIHKNVDSV